MEYFVEVEYLSRRSFFDCYMFAHEIGHTFYYEFMKQTNAIDVISRGFARLIRLIEPRMSLDEPRLARNITSIMHWLMEFVADEAAVIAMGPVIPCFWYREQCSKWDFRKGGWSHPPPSVRFNFMKKRALQVSSLESFENEWTDVLRATDDILGHELRRFSRISKRVFLNPELHERLWNVAQIIVNWAEIRPDYASIHKARSAIESGVSPKTYRNAFAAFLELDNPELDLLEITGKSGEL